MGLGDLAGQWFGGLKSHARETTTLDAGAEERLLRNVLSHGQALPPALIPGDTDVWVARDCGMTTLR